MPKCDACRAEGAKQRCTKCQGCWSCNRACAKRFWKTHKRFCTEDPALKPHVPIELAVERALAREPKTEAPPNATCYICLDTEGPNGETVTRGCACRGPSAGFVHVDCLAEMASHSGLMVLGEGTEVSRWDFCPTCRSGYVGALAIELTRRKWRRDRDSPDSDVKHAACFDMAIHLRPYDELNAAYRLDEGFTLPPSAGTDAKMQLWQTMIRARNLQYENRHHEALEILTRLRPSVERRTDTEFNPRLFHGFLMARSLANLGRFRDALPFAVEAVERHMEAEGPESQATLGCMQWHATILAGIGQVGEAKVALARVIAAQTRLLGADHPDTLQTRQVLDHIKA